MDTSFLGSKLKIKRANQHINELQGILMAFLKTDFYRLFIERDPDGRNYVLKFEAIREMPCEVPLVIGDIVHNLRAALDLMASEIVTMAGDKPDRWTKFPFHKTRQDLVAAINGGKIKAAPPAIIDLIVDTIKPYEGGNGPLCALDDLDIVDKHKLLIPVASIVGLRDVSVEDEGGNRFQLRQIAVGQDGKLNMISTPYKLNITNYGQPTFGIFFAKGQIFEGQSVIPTLHQLSQLVSGIVQTIEKAYLALGNG